MEVRQCPLGSGARSGGPAVPTGIWTARRRWGRRMRRRRRRRRRTALIKSNNPHLAGGEQKGAKQRRHVFNFESRLQGFVQIKSLIAGTGCCKCPAFPAFFLPDNTLSKRCKGAVAATLPFVPTHSMLCGFSREKLMNLHILQIDTNSSNCGFGCIKMHI